MKKLFLLVLAIFYFHITYAQTYEIVEYTYDNIQGNSNYNNSYESIGGYNSYSNSSSYRQTPQAQNVRANAIGKDFHSGEYLKIPIIVSIQGQNIKVTKYYSDGEWHSISGGSRVEKCSSLSARYNPLEGQYMYKAYVQISNVNHSIIGNIYFDL